MKPSRSMAFPSTIVLGSLVILACACGPAPNDGTRDRVDAGGVDAAIAAHDWRFHRRSHPVGDASAPSATTDATMAPGTPSTNPLPTGSGGSGGGTVVIDCDTCTRANACCDAVAGDSSCTYSAAACAAETGAAQADYQRNCVAFIRLVIDAWSASGKAPPQQCSLP